MIDWKFCMGVLGQMTMQLYKSNIKLLQTKVGFLHMKFSHNRFQLNSSVLI